MADKMKAMIFYEPNKMELEEVDIPSLGPDEVLIQVKATGICGSDVAYYFGDSSLETESGKGPLVLGHELSGVVQEVGEIPARQGLFAPGDRVTADPVQFCNACDTCCKGQPNLCETKSVLGVSCDGGFAEYVKAKYTAVHKLPDNVTFKQGAFAEPLACATYGVKNLDVQPGDFCVVFGPGPIGLVMLQLIKSRGAGKTAVVGTRDYRLDAAKQFGADFVFNPQDASSKYYVEDLKSAIADLTGGLMADRAIVATGSEKPMETALAITGRRSVIVLFGLPGDDTLLKVPVLESILWDKTIRFSWLAPLVWPTAIRSIAEGLVDLDPLFTHEYALEDLVDALAKVKAREGNPLKAIVVL